MQSSPGASIPDWLRHRALSTPDRLALVCGDDRLSYSEIDAAVEAASRRLYNEGVQPGDVVALLGRNSTAFVVAVHAIVRLGAILMPLNIAAAGGAHPSPRPPPRRRGGGGLFSCTGSVGEKTRRMGRQS
jgi:acyl-CoA synthetase (AMP-forming)/AMP-acid ligase II